MPHKKEVALIVPNMVAAAIRVPHKVAVALRVPNMVAAMGMRISLLDVRFHST